MVATFFIFLHVIWYLCAPIVHCLLSDLVRFVVLYWLDASLQQHGYSVDLQLVGS